MNVEPDDTGAASPPRWMQSLVRALLPERDRETVTGDLLEEYGEEVRPRRGAARASWWYLRQAGSLLPWAVARRWADFEGRRGVMTSPVVGLEQTSAVRTDFLRGVTQALGALILVMMAAVFIMEVAIAVNWGSRFAPDSALFWWGRLTRLGALALGGVFGWWAFRGDPRAGNYAWAAVGPFLMGIGAPGSQIWLVVSLLAATAARWQAPARAAAAPPSS